MGRYLSDALGSYLRHTSNIGVNDPEVTACQWVRIRAADLGGLANGDRILDVGGFNSFDGGYTFYILDATPKVEIIIWDNANNSQSLTGGAGGVFPTDAWTPIIIRSDADGRHEAWIGATKVGDYTSGFIRAQAWAKIGINNGAEYVGSNGRMECGDLVVWNTLLSDENITLLQEGYEPHGIATDDIVFSWQVAGDVAPEPNVIGSATLAVTPVAAKVAGPVAEFPAIHEWQDTVDRDSYTVSLPATVEDRELLLLLFCASGPNPVNVGATPDGWTLETSQQSDETVVAVYKRYGYATDSGGSVVIPLTATVDGASAQVHRISRWTGLVTEVEAAIAAFSASANPNPPNLAASWGAEDGNLWLAIAGHGDDDRGVTAYPTDFFNGVNTVTGGGANSGGSVASSRWYENVANKDPGTFTLNGVASGAAVSVVIRPGVPGPEPPPPPVAADTLESKTSLGIGISL